MLNTLDCNLLDLLNSSPCTNSRHIIIKTKHTHAKKYLIGLQDFGVEFHFWAGVCPDVSSLSERCGFETTQSRKSRVKRGKELPEILPCVKTDDILQNCVNYSDDDMPMQTDEFEAGNVSSRDGNTLL